MTMNNKVLKAEMSRRAGFTLIEVLLVVAILGMLAGVVAVKFGGKSKGALIKTTRVSIAALSTAVDMYEVDTGRYPATLNNLISSDGAPNWNGPYLKGTSLPVDGWGIPFAYQKSGDNYKIVSAGPDASMGGGDDITSF
ncbi:MAG: general secretion pathway protein G [Candidatus Promineifilaceae bacterium]|jgi:general secretion pathway protein G